MRVVNHGAEHGSSAVVLEQIGRDDAAEVRRVLAEHVGSPFSTLQWSEAWWREFGSGREPCVMACRLGAEVIGIVPLAVQRIGVIRVARLIGSGPADHLQPLCEPGDRQTVASALMAALDSGAIPCDVLLLERLPPSWSGLLPGNDLKQEASPLIVAADGGWEGYLAGRSANFRSQVRRKERRLARDHSVAYRLADAASLESDLTTLFDLHDARWAGRGSGALSGSRATFHREFARAALDQGWLRLWTLDVDGQPAAAWHGFRIGAGEWYYQSGRDPALDHLSVGAILLAHTIRSALDDGIREYQLLRGDESYKQRYATEDQTLVTRAFAANVRGKLALAAAQSAVRVGGPVRSALVRRGG